MPKEIRRNKLYSSPNPDREPFLSPQAYNRAFSIQSIASTFIYISIELIRDEPNQKAFNLSFITANRRREYDKMLSYAIVPIVQSRVK